ncbi:MAG: hypothetical protein HY909_12600 [Deltaproteobacteria bacterium]|nr:hypothetical protein [Deltaproteobacteria bacterium]
MSAAQLPPGLASVQPEDLAAYLTGAGWTRRPFSRSDVLVFQGPTTAEDAVEVVFPASASARDFADQLERVVHGVAELEARPPEALVRDLLRADSDRLRVCLRTSAASHGTLPLPVVVRLGQSLYDLLVAAACAEESPRASFPRPTAAALRFASTCRFGPAAEGGFVANVDLPVAPSIGAGPQTPPLGRRVSDRILRGFGRVRDAVLGGGADAVLAGYGDGLNANMCEAVLGLRVELRDLQLELAVGPSPRVPATAGLAREVLLEARAFDLLEAVARGLRGVGPLVQRELHGVIVALSDDDAGDEEGDADGARIVTLRSHEGARWRLVRFALDEVHYRLACDAHRDRAPVRVLGLLDRSERPWRLRTVGAFGRILDPPSAA